MFFKVLVLSACIAVALSAPQPFLDIPNAAADVVTGAGHVANKGVSAVAKFVLQTPGFFGVGADTLIRGVAQGIGKVLKGDIAGGIDSALSKGLFDGVNNMVNYAAPRLQDISNDVLNGVGGGLKAAASAGKHLVSQN